MVKIHLEEMLKKISLAAALFFFPFAKALAFDFANENFYTKVHKQVVAHSWEIPVANTAKGLNVNTLDLAGLLAGDLKNLPTLCKSVGASAGNFSNLQHCLNEIKSLFLFEKSLAEMQLRAFENSLATEIWTDGDLNNSSFDLVADLNVIDAIFFESANILNSRFENSFSQAQLPKLFRLAGLNGVQQKATPKPSPTFTTFWKMLFPAALATNDLQDDLQIENDDQIPACFDPDEIFLETRASQEGNLNGQSIGIPDQQSANENANESSENENDFSTDEDEEADSSDFPNEADRNDSSFPDENAAFHGGEFPDFSEGASESGKGCSGDVVEMFGRIFCIPKFCGQHICIEIDFVPQGEGGKRNNFNKIAGIVGNMKENLQPLFEERNALTPSENTNKSWQIVDWHLPAIGVPISVFTKSPVRIERKESEKMPTATETFSEFQREIFPEGFADFVEETGQSAGFANNEVLLEALFPNCDTLLASSPEADLMELSQNCESEIANATPGIMGTGNILAKRELAGNFQIGLKNERKKNWEKYLKNFAENLEKIGEIVWQLSNKKEIEKIFKTNCKNS